jgi:hypothetical protein
MKARRHLVRFLSAMGVAILAGLLISSSHPSLPLSLPSPPDNQPRQATIVLPSSLWEDPALQLAAKDLQLALEAAGVSTSLQADQDWQAPATYSILVGGPDTPWTQRLVEAGLLALPPLGEEGYLIQSVKHRDSPVISVVGGGILGQAYGLFRLAERLRLDPEILRREIRLQAEPMMTLRVVSSPGLPDYPSPAEALRWGFNAVMIEPWPALALYDRYDPAILDPQRYASQRAWVQANRARAREQIAAAKALHLQVISPGDLFHFPPQILSLYGEQVASPQAPNLLCIARPKTQELLSSTLREVLTDFPQIDAIMVRTGENYPLGPLAGHTPAQGACDGLSYSQRLRQVIEVVYQEVVGVQGKVYIQRAWDLGDEGFHASPEVARSIVAGMEGKKGFLLSFKHTQTDFWRYNPVNPNLGRLGVPQMVEFQMAREYEGKGAFPNYLGELLARGAPEVEPRGGMDYFYQQGVRAIWVWAKGGGWGGPHLASDLWVEANLYAASHLAWDTHLRPETLAMEWATLRFGPQAAPWVVSLLLKSDEAVLKTFYVAPAAVSLGPWAPNALWVRDDLIRGEPQMESLLQVLGSEDGLEAALTERKEGLAVIASMMGDLEAAEPLIPDRALAAEALASLRYEQALAQVLAHYLGCMLYYHRWQASGGLDEGARQAALEEWALWKQAWEYYNREVGALAGTASLYKDAGMGQAMEAVRAELEGG